MCTRFIYKQSVQAGPINKPGGQTHRFLESKVGTNKGEGHRDSKPQGQNSHQSAKGDCCWGTLHPKDQVHQEEVCKHNTSSREEDNRTKTKRGLKHVRGIFAVSKAWQGLCKDRTNAQNMGQKNKSWANEASEHTLGTGVLSARRLSSTFPLQKLRIKQMNVSVMIRHCLCCLIRRKLTNL